MSGLYDIYVLSQDRSLEMVNRFLDCFLPRRSEAADEYAVPHLADQPRQSFSRAAELLAHLESQPREAHAIYWSTEDSGDPRIAMVFPTAEGRMIYGLSVADNAEDYLTELKAFLNVAQGYIDFETPPPDNAAAFEAAVRKFEKRSNK